MTMILVYITTPNKKEAGKIIRHLLEKRLIACANIFPVKSLYRWKGKIAKGNEFVAIAKAPAKNYAAIKKETAKIHPYEIPCIIKISAAANPEFSRWIEEETKIPRAAV